MGFLDKLKSQATDVASTVVEKTQETARVGQIQVQLRTLRSEERDLMAEFGRAAYRMHQEGTLGASSPELTSTASKIEDVRARLSEKEAEAADARGEGRPTDENTVEADAEEIIDASSRSAADSGATGTTSASRATTAGTETGGSSTTGSTSGGSRGATGSASTGDGGDGTTGSGTL